MKAAALRHLLLDRARHAIASGGDNQRSSLHSIVRSLSVTRDGSWFEIRWKDSGGERTLNVPLSTFAFYVTGDNPAAVAKRQGTLNLRAANWEAAADVLGRMVASGGSFSHGGETYGHVLPSAPPVASHASPYSIGLTVIAAVTAGWLGGPLAGVGVLLATALSLMLFRQAVSAGGQPEPMLLEEIMVTVFVVATPFVGQPTSLALVLLAVGAPCIAEIAKGRPWSWFLAGLAGAPALAMGTPGMAAVGVLALSAFASCWMMPDRFSWAGAALYVLGALLGFLLPHDWFALQGEAPGMLVLVPSLLLGFSFALWWFHGVQRQVYPWYVQLSLAAAAWAAFDVPGCSALVGLTGLGLVISTRVIRVFRQSRREQR